MSWNVGCQLGWRELCTSDRWYRRETRDQWLQKSRHSGWIGATWFSVFDISHGRPRGLRSRQREWSRFCMLILCMERKR